jgi:hypothetical protein
MPVIKNAHNNISMTPVSVLVSELSVVLESARQLPHHDVSVFVSRLGRNRMII